MHFNPFSVLCRPVRDFRYSTLAWIPEADGSWALPLRHERITSFETPTSRAAFQLKLVTRQLQARPLAAYDRGYGNAKFVQATAGIEADLLLRLASNRCLWGKPDAKKGRGAPRKHGHKFKLNDPTTWPEADEALIVEDPKIGQVKLMHWSGYHFLESSRRDMEIIRVEVIQPVGRKRKFKALWLAWLGKTLPPLEDFWHKYLRRFVLEHCESSAEDGFPVAGDWRTRRGIASPSRGYIGHSLN